MIIKSLLILTLLALGEVTMSGCASHPALGIGTPISHEQLRQIKKGASESEIIALLGSPRSVVPPTRQEQHSMMSGSTWTKALEYDGEPGNNRPVAKAVRVYLNNNAMVAWSFPFYTMQQYEHMVAGVNDRRMLTIAALQDQFGWLTSVRSLGPGGDGRYHLVQADGSIYPSAITVGFAGPNLYSISLANLR